MSGRSCDDRVNCAGSDMVPEPRGRKFFVMLDLPDREPRCSFLVVTGLTVMLEVSSTLWSKYFLCGGRLNVPDRVEAVLFVADWEPST